MQMEDFVELCVLNSLLFLLLFSVFQLIGLFGFHFLAAPLGMWDHNSPSRDGIRPWKTQLGLGRKESLTLDYHSG